MPTSTCGVEDCEHHWTGPIPGWTPSMKLCCCCGWLHELGTRCRPDDGGAWVYDLMDALGQIHLGNGVWVPKD